MSRLTLLLYVVSLCIVCGLSQEVADLISDYSQFDDDCFDSVGPVYKGMSCGQLVNESSGYCYTAIEDYCCISCAKVDSGINDCEYGDRSLDCDVDSCSKYDDDTREDLCCETCAAFLESEKGNNEEEGPTTTPVASQPSPPSQPTPEKPPPAPPTPPPLPTPPPTTAPPTTTPKPVIKAPKPSTKPAITKPKVPMETPGIPVYISQSHPTIEIKQQENIFQYKKPKLPAPPKDINSVVIQNRPLIPITEYEPPVDVPVKKTVEKVEKTKEKTTGNVYKFNEKVKTIMKPKVEIFDSGPAADWIEPGHVISDTQKYLTLSAPQMSSPNQLQKTVLSMPVLEQKEIAVHNSFIPVNTFQEPIPHTETLVQRFQGDGSLGVGVISPVEKTFIKTSLNNMIAPVKHAEEKEIINTNRQNILSAKGKKEIAIQEPFAKMEAPVIDHALPASIETAIVGKPLNKHQSVETPVVKQHNDLQSLHPENIQDLATIIVGSNGEITIENPNTLEKAVQNNLKKKKNEKQNEIKTPKEPISSSKSALKTKESVKLKTEKPVVTKEISLNDKDDNLDDDDNSDKPSPSTSDDVSSTAPVAEQGDSAKPAKPKVHYIIEEREQPLTLQNIYPVKDNNLDKNLFIRKTYNFKVITRKRTKSTNYGKSVDLLASGKTKPKKPKPIILNDIHLNSSPVRKPKPIILREAHFNAPTVSSNFVPRSFHSTDAFSYRPKLFIIKYFRNTRPIFRRQIRLRHRQRPRLFQDDSNGLIHNFHTIGEFPSSFTFNTLPFSFFYPTLPYEYPILSHSFPTFSSF